MNCREVSKYLNAFADGELETRDNLMVLDHVKLCPACCEKVSLQQQLRQAIRLSAAREQAPAALRARIAGALLAETATTGGEGESAGPPATADPSPPAAGTGPQRVIRLWRYLAPITAVAAVLMFIILSRLHRSGDAVGPGTAFALLDYTDTRPQAIALADRIYRVHSQGLPAAAEDQIPASPGEAARYLSGKIGSTVLWCERLAAAGRSISGTFAGAGVCEFTDDSGRTCRGARLVFRCPTGETISLISVPQLSVMRTLTKAPHDTRDYAILKPSATAEQMTVVAFNCPMGTHFLCAPVDPPTAVALIEPTTLAHATATHQPSATLRGTLLGMIGR
ncbi:MAG: zf-HC2 domain-containing protein [Planctomycetes bacterium]|nr:zf-HC2 domain-containing protein [Planctomycetota bacterium]